MSKERSFAPQRKQTPSVPNIQKANISQRLRLKSNRPRYSRTFCFCSHARSVQVLIKLLPPALRFPDIISGSRQYRDPCHENDHCNCKYVIQPISLYRQHDENLRYQYNISFEPTITVSGFLLSLPSIYYSDHIPVHFRTCSSPLPLSRFLRPLLPPMILSKSDESPSLSESSPAPY